MDLLDVCHLKHLVTQPIRMTNATKTLIDLILTNNTRRVLRTGVVDTHICDHSLVYTILRSRCPDLDKEKSIFAALKTLIVINSWSISAQFLFILWKFFMIPMTCCMYLNRYTMTFSMITRLWSMLMYAVIKFPTWTINGALPYAKEIASGEVLKERELIQIMTCIRPREINVHHFDGKQ